MIQLPDYEEFKQLVNDVAEIREENRFLRAVVLARHSLSRAQVLKALDVSETTLWRITKSGELRNYPEGSKTLYDLDSVRSYLTARKFTRNGADNRIIQACYGT